MVSAIINYLTALRFTLHFIEPLPRNAQASMKFASETFPYVSHIVSQHNPYSTLTYLFPRVLHMITSVDPALATVWPLGPGFGLGCLDCPQAIGMQASEEVAASAVGGHDRERAVAGLHVSGGTGDA